MASAHSKYLDDFAARQIKVSISQTDSNVYLTFGKSSPWISDASPPQSNTSVASFNDVWRNMIGAKKITGNNVRHAIPRFNWTPNTVYTAYDHMIDSKALKNDYTKFHVLTSDYNVYKCLSNNYSSNSTVMPNTTVTTTHVQTSDGYIWKYMYTLTAEEQLRFLTPSFLPIRTQTVQDSSTQWQVQQDAIKGAIHVINVTNGGNNYTTNDITVSITGDGKDANAFAVLNTTSNTVSSIVVDDIGYGYTYASVELISASGSGATARAIISPPGGHGSDPLTELGGSYLIFDIQFKNDEEGVFTVHNDYRQIAIIEDPFVFGTTNTFSTTAASQLYEITLNGTSAEYLENEWVYQGVSLDTATFKGYVTEWDSGNNIIKLSQTEGTVTKDLLIGDTTTAARFVSIINNPDMEPYTGKLLYIDNIIPIERAIDQTEDFKIVLNF